MPIEPPPRQDNYVIDPESGAEMARLIDQDHFITEQIGGLFPPDVDPSTLHQVLDLACGPGGWAREVAFNYWTYGTKVIGVDISEAMIEYAQAMAKVQDLNNATFQVMDVREPLDFDDDSFDFVNVRFLAYSLKPEEWPGLIAECKRVLKPGGILRLTEAEDIGVSNSAALEEINELARQAARKTGRAFFPAGRFIGTMFMLGRFMREAGFADIVQQAYSMDWSAGTKASGVALIQVDRQNYRASSAQLATLKFQDGIGDL
jgi:SAM-dependent methyltransferase